MPLIVNLRHLEERNDVLRGELPLNELDLETGDEMIRVAQPLRHDLEVQKLDRRPFDPRPAAARRWSAECVRCLKPFKRELELNPIGRAICRWRARKPRPSSTIAWT